MNPTSQNTRLHLLDIGYQLIAHKGYSAVGLSEILKQAQVPKGSFYHYFASKDAFGTELIQHYFACYHLRVDALWQTPAANGRMQLLNYWQHWQQSQQCHNPEQPCLVVKLSAEVSDLSDPMRLALLEGSDSVMQRLIRCMQDGQADGSISPQLDPEVEIPTLYALWLGASLSNKLTQDDQPLQLAMHKTLSLLPEPHRP
ncbi:MAG: TetR/AcrR family transcriptional regulator [Neisseriaceae bacterium]|nr:TetR/AcrR family transcriptional regulator [Neisseriaceae bacterium]